MSVNSTLQNQLCSKLRMVGLPRDVVLPLVNHLALCASAEGPENVVRRLKRLKQAAVNEIAGQPTDMSWIAHRPDGTPKGPWKPVWQLLRSQQYKHRKRAFNALMVYASVVLPRKAGPTATQERKFLSSVCQPAGNRRSGIDRFQRTVNLADVLRPFTGDLRINSEVPNCITYALQKWGTEEKGVGRLERHVNNFFQGAGFKPYLKSHLVRSAIQELGTQWYGLLAGTSSFLTDEWNQPKGTRLDCREANQSPIGVIGSSQEPGLKFRAFASPNIVLQAALEPLKITLFDALRKCPWDCTYDQDKGVRWVQDKLRDNNTCFSVDLSDATNNFPLDIQDRLLALLRIPLDHRELFFMVSRGAYVLSWDKTRTVQWTVGQPLGAGPSFAAFALAHAGIALVAERVGNPGCEPGSTFRILGDDFITCNEGTHSAYRRILDILGCPVSLDKCLTSSVAGEFAGKLITANHVYHGFKYKALTDSSFMPMLRTLGSRALSRSFLDKGQLRYANLLKDVPEPQGLGFNPKGLPFSQRWEKYLHMQQYLEKLKPEVPKVSDAEMRNAFYHGVHSKWITYGEAEREYPGVAPDNMAEPYKREVFVPRDHHELLRNARLRAQQLVSGDPRASQLIASYGKIQAAASYAENRMGAEPGPDAILLSEMCAGPVTRDTNLGETKVEIPGDSKKPIKVSKGPTMKL